MIIILCLIFIPIILLLIKLILNLIVKIFGKISYDGFSSIGFAYDSEKEIFYSVENAWQRDFGYTYVYDVWAPIFRMIIDTEPIKFYYNNRNWLITFWKGQYGILTGAEIGIYCTEQKRVNKKTIYFPVSDSEMPNIYITLYKNGKVITRIDSKHWWLAVFKLGMFSWPKELSMDINITFKDQQMLGAFLDSFNKLGYTSDDFKIIDNTFCFKFIKPRTRKVWTRNFLMDRINQFFNRKNVELYNEYLSEFIDDNKVDDSKRDNKLIMVNELIPDVLKNQEKSSNKED